MDDPVPHPRCPACGSDRYGRFLILSMRRAVEPSHTWEAVVDVSVRCVRCRHGECLHHSLEVDADSELSDIRRGLEYETGLPVFIDPPDDPPAGVREPRRPPPSDDSLASQLDLPRH